MPTPVQPTPVVNSHNEWDPLEEVIVGVLDGAADLPWEIGLHAVTPAEDVEKARVLGMSHGGAAIDRWRRAAAEKELAEFVRVLEAEGVTVRRPEPIDQARPFGSPDWVTPGGNCQANPRDVLIVFGNEILEAPMSWRSRYFEFLAYRTLVKDYWRQGARWTAAPKPRLSPKLYNYNWMRGEEWVTTEYEPVFDAADVCRCGRDLFVQRSHVTNESGIEWLRRHLGDEYRVHQVEFADDRAIHIDATFVPLAPGKLLVNPDRPIKTLPVVFDESGWELLTPPRSTLPTDHPHYRYFRWLSMNVLSLDEERVIVEAEEEPMIRALEDWGFKPIPIAFRNNYRYGGSFHCATVDIRRRGELKSYFPLT